MIKAYDFLYENYVKKDKFVQTQISTDIEGGVYSKKVQILKENLFGVDLDEVATEIIQLNLLLKITEKKQHLPILQQNIRHGNSLIEDNNIDPFAFNWKEEFHQILNNEEGFDIIIGNPPYVRQEKIVPIKPTLESNFEVFDGKADLYVYFFERGIRLLKEKGFFAFIVSNKWLKVDYGKKLRPFLSKYFIEEIIDFGDIQIFKGATTYPCIIILKNIKKSNPKMKITLIKSEKFKPFQKYISNNQFFKNQKSLGTKIWSIDDPNSNQIMEQFDKNCITLDQCVKGNVYRGVTTGLNDAFIINENIKNKIIKEDKKVLKS